MARTDPNDGEKAVERQTDGAWTPTESGDATVEEKDLYPPTFKLSRKQKALRVPMIRRMAFRQKDLELTDSPDPDIKKLVLEAFTSRLADAERKKMRSLVKAVRKTLKPLIPPMLRSVYYYYPQCIKENPGFLYTTSDKEVSVWVVPQLPMFLEKIDEMEALKEICEGDLSRLDEKAKAYDSAKKAKDAEIKRLAGILSEVRNGKPITYVDFLQDHPLYFDAMYRLVTGKDLLEGVQLK